MTPRVVLVGLPGAGKTTTGRRLASRLKAPFADSDSLVEARTGRTVAQIFADDGEAAFRTLEAEVIAEALTGFDGVLALGGGAVMTGSTRAALKSATVPIVLLRSSIRTLTRRVGTAVTRPLLTDDPRARLLALAREREPVYRELARFTVDTDRRSSSQVAAEIAALIQVPAAPR